MQARRTMAKDGDRVASRGRRRAAAKRRRGRPRKRRSGGGWRSSIAEAAGGAASVASFDSLSLSRPAWRAAPPSMPKHRGEPPCLRARTLPLLRTCAPPHRRARARAHSRPVRRSTPTYGAHTWNRRAPAPSGPVEPAASPRAGAVRTCRFGRISAVHRHHAAPLGRPRRHPSCAADEAAASSRPRAAAPSRCVPPQSLFTAGRLRRAASEKSEFVHIF